MSSKSNCNVAALVEFYYSWPVVLLLSGGYLTLVPLSELDKQQGYAVMFAMSMAYSCFIFIAAIATFRGIDFSLKGRLPALRCWFGSISTIAMTIYAVLRIFNIPVWAFDKGMLVKLYLGCFLVSNIVFLIARSRNDARKTPAAIESRQKRDSL